MPEVAFWLPAPVPESSFAESAALSMTLVMVVVLPVLPALPALPAFPSLPLPPSSSSSPPSSSCPPASSSLPPTLLLPSPLKSVFTLPKSPGMSLVTCAMVKAGGVAVAEVVEAERALPATACVSMFW